MVSVFPAGFQLTGTSNGVIVARVRTLDRSSNIYLCFTNIAYKLKNEANKLGRAKNASISAQDGWR